MQKMDWPLKPDFDYKKPVLNEELDCQFIGNLKKGFAKPFSFFATNYACVSKTAVLENTFLNPL